MIFSIVISASPKRPVVNEALEFCKALIAHNDVTLRRVFLLGEGVKNASNKFPGNSKWQEFLSENNVDAACCVASAQKYNLADDSGNPLADVLPPFQVTGLGQLIEAEVSSDRVITFGQSE